MSFLLTTSNYGDIWQNNPLKYVENKTQPSLCLQHMAATEPADFHQVQNIYGCFFATGRFEDLTFCKPDLL